MALQLSQTNKQGFTGDYWKINNIGIDVNMQVIQITTNLYKSQTDMKYGGVQAMGSQRDTFSGEEFLFIVQQKMQTLLENDPTLTAYNAVRTLAYQALKTTDFFSGSIDV